MDERKEAEVEVRVKEIALDPALNVPVVMLEPRSGEGGVLPIWIGAFEANAIALHFQEGRPPRPLTHDLFLSSIEALGARITKLLVSDLVESTFISVLHMDRKGQIITLDARPSDGIALALRAGAPIFVNQSVLEKARSSQSHSSSGHPVEENADEQPELDGPPKKTDWMM